MLLKFGSLMMILTAFSSPAQAQPIEDLIPGRYAFSKAESKDVGVNICGNELVVTKAQKTASLLFLGPSFQFIPRTTPRTVEPSNPLTMCNESDESTREQKDGITVLTRELTLDCPTKREYDHRTFWKATIHRTGKIEIDMAMRDGPKSQEEAKAKCVWIKK